MNASLVVFFGAGFGGVLRHLIKWLDQPGGRPPVSTRHPCHQCHRLVRDGAHRRLVCVAGTSATGTAPIPDNRILGGFTTFSAFSLDVALLYERGQPWLAATYVTASVILSIGGLFAALWGMRLWST